MILHPAVCVSHLCFHVCLRILVADISLASEVSVVRFVDGVDLRYA